MVVSPSASVSESDRGIGGSPGLRAFADHGQVLLVAFLVGFFVNEIVAGVILVVLLYLRPDLRRQWRWRLLALFAIIVPPVFLVAAPTVLVREAVAPKLAYWKRYREWPYEYDRTPEHVLWWMLGAAVILPPGPLRLALSIVNDSGVSSDVVPSLIHPGHVLGLAVYALTAFCIALRPDLRSPWRWRIALGLVVIEYAILASIVVAT